MAKTSRQILVITDVEDVHVPYVQKHLKTPMILLDPRALLRGTTLTYETKSGHTIPTYDGIVLDSVSGVWFRKPQNVTLDVVPVAEPYKKYAARALETHFSSLYAAFQDACWISDYYSLWRASDKTLQLTLAKQIGFKVPDTVATSDANVAREFIATHDASIVKTLASAWTKVEGVRKGFYTTLVDKKKMPSFDNLYLSPAIFQAAIDPDFELRVTVVGDKVFPATVRYDSPDPKKYAQTRDWRLGHAYGKLAFGKYDAFPSDIADMCRCHVKDLGLMFGAIDLIVDKEGDYWFLENNPNGQWAFIEISTGQQIGKAIADLLEAGSV